MRRLTDLVWGVGLLAEALWRHLRRSGTRQSRDISSGL